MKGSDLHTRIHIATALAAFEHAPDITFDHYYRAKVMELTRQTTEALEFQRKQKLKDANKKKKKLSTITIEEQKNAGDEIELIIGERPKEKTLLSQTKKQEAIPAPQKKGHVLGPDIELEIGEKPPAAK